MVEFDRSAMTGPRDLWRQSVAGLRAFLAAAMAKFKTEPIETESP